MSQVERSQALRRARFFATLTWDNYSSGLDISQSI